MTIWGPNLYAGRRHEWTQIITGIRKVDQLVGRKEERAGDSEAKRG